MHCMQTCIGHVAGDPREVHISRILLFLYVWFRYIVCACTYMYNICLCISIHTCIYVYMYIHACMNASVSYLVRSRPSQAVLQAAGPWPRTVLPTKDRVFVCYFYTLRVQSAEIQGV